MKLNNQEVEIKALPLKRYAELLEILNVLPQQIEEISKMENDEITRQLPRIIQKNLAEFIKIVAIGTGLTEDEVNEFNLMDLIKAVQAVIIANQFAEVWEEIKKVIPLALTPATKRKE